MKPVVIAEASLVAIALTGPRARADERWVDDRAVLAPKRFVVSAGFGVVRFAPNTRTSRPMRGTGLSFEEAAGLGRSLELGVRFGLRLDDTGRGLRADEIARGVDTETAGTGLSVAPNPELRLRWRSLDWEWGEAGLETRVVLPLVSDPSLTDTLGVWTSLHLGHVARADVGFVGVASRCSFAADTVVVWAFGAPVRFWVNLGDSAFVGLLSSVRYLAPTHYSSDEVRWTTGFGVGYRIPWCDVISTARLPDTTRDFARRIGASLGLSCRL